MSRANLSGEIIRHRKFKKLTKEQIGCWTLGLGWCAEKKSDGRISRRAAEILGISAKSAAALVKARLWEPAADGNGWVFHDYLDHNPSAAKKEEEGPEQMDLLMRIAALEDVVDIGEPLERARIGYEWWKSFTKTSPDMHSWRREFREFGGKSEYEREMVARHYHQTPYIIDKTGPRNPGHVLKHWEDFVVGPKGLGFKPTKVPGAVSSANDFDETQNPDWLEAGYGR